MKTKRYTEKQVARMIKTQGAMDIRTQPGMLVVFTSPANGYECHQDDCRRLGLVVGQTYEVQDIKVGRSSSSFTLREFPGEHFNTVMFCNTPRQPLPETTKHLDYYIPPRR